MSPSRISRHPAAGHWDVLTRLASRYLDPAWDPWQTFTLPAGGPADLIPPGGPVVYASLDDRRCFWAGQSEDLRGRVQQHLSHDYRRARWHYVAAIKLVSATPGWVVDRLERDTATRLRPCDGRKWPRA